jgi:hypothetical protein
MPYLGDTTSTQSLLFSPLLLASPQPQPNYPNYTLPPVIMTPPAIPDFSFSELDLLIIPTGSSPTESGLDNSHCAALNSNITTGALGSTNLVVNATTEWMAIGDEEGYRTYWVIGGLMPSSNYTAYYYESTTRTLSQSIWFTTKQCTSSCPLSDSLTTSIIPMPISPTHIILPLYRLLCPINSQHIDHPLLACTPRYTPGINHHSPNAITRIILHFPILKSLREGLLLPHLLMPRLLHFLPGLDLPKSDPKVYRSPNNIIRWNIRSTRSYTSPNNTRNRR